MKNKKAIIPLQMIVIIVGIILVSVVVVLALQKSGEVINDDGVLTSKRTVECDVTVKMRAISGIKITDFSCDTKKGCGIFSSLSLFKEKGNVRLLDSNMVLDRKRVELTTLFNEQETVTLKGCTADYNVKIRLSDEDDNLLEEKTVRLI